MLGCKPDPKLWERVNEVILDENMAVTMVTFISAMCSMLIQAGVVKDENAARVHLAAMLVSPDTGPAGSLLPLVSAEVARIDDGKWIQ